MFSKAGRDSSKWFSPPSKKEVVLPIHQGSIDSINANPNSTPSPQLANKKKLRRPQSAASSPQPLYQHQSQPSTVGRRISRGSSHSPPVPSSSSSCSPSQLGAPLLSPNEIRKVVEAAAAAAEEIKEASPDKEEDVPAARFKESIPTTDLHAATTTTPMAAAAAAATGGSTASKVLFQNRLHELQAQLEQLYCHSPDGHDQSKPESKNSVTPQTVSKKKKPQPFVTTKTDSTTSVDATTVNPFSSFKTASCIHHSDGGMSNPFAVPPISSVSPVVDHTQRNEDEGDHHSVSSASAATTSTSVFGPAASVLLQQLPAVDHHTINNKKDKNMRSGRKHHHQQQQKRPVYASLPKEKRGCSTAVPSPYKRGGGDGGGGGCQRGEGRRGGSKSPPPSNSMSIKVSSHSIVSSSSSSSSQEAVDRQLLQQQPKAKHRRLEQHTKVKMVHHQKQEPKPLHGAESGGRKQQEEEEDGGRRKLDFSTLSPLAGAAITTTATTSTNSPTMAIVQLEKQSIDGSSRSSNSGSDDAAADCRSPSLCRPLQEDDQENDGRNDNEASSSSSFSFCSSGKSYTHYSDVNNLSHQQQEPTGGGERDQDQQREHRGFRDTSRSLERDYGDEEEEEAATGGLLHHLDNDYDPQECFLKASDDDEENVDVEHGVEGIDTGDEPEPEEPSRSEPYISKYHHHHHDDQPTSGREVSLPRVTTLVGRGTTYNHHHHHHRGLPVSNKTRVGVEEDAWPSQMRKKEEEANKEEGLEKDDASTQELKKQQPKHKEEQEEKALLNTLLHWIAKGDNGNGSTRLWTERDEMLLHTSLRASGGGGDSTDADDGESTSMMPPQVLPSLPPTSVVSTTSSSSSASSYTSCCVLDWEKKIIESTAQHVLETFVIEVLARLSVTQRVTGGLRKPGTSSSASTSSVSSPSQEHKEAPQSSK